MDLSFALDDLFDGEPEGFDPEPNPFAKTLEEELADIWGGNAPVHAFTDDWTELKAESDKAKGSENMISTSQPYDTEATVKNETASSNIIKKEFASSTVEPHSDETVRVGPEFDKFFRHGQAQPWEASATRPNSSTKMRHDLSADTAQGVPFPRKWVSSRSQFQELLNRANTPSELELEQMDFQLQKVVEQIDSISVRQELHKVDPSLSKRKLFRIYRYVMKQMQDSDDEHEHQEQDAERFGFFTGGSNDHQGLGFVDSESSNNTSRNTSRDALTKSESTSEGSSKAVSKESKTRSTSSLLQSKPYLQEINPTDVEGHFPTTISRSSHRIKSRTSSLASETRFERKSSPTELVLAPVSMTGPEVAAQSRLLPAPLFYSANSTTLSPGRSSPLRIPAASPTASVYAVAGSPAPDPASIIQYDSEAEELASGHFVTVLEDELMQDSSPYTSGVSHPPSTGQRPSPLFIEHRPSDPFAAGSDKIEFSPLTYSPPLSPLLGLAGQINQPKRHNRRKAGGGDKGKKPPARTVSARRNIQRASLCTKGDLKSVAALSVQGHNVKISKSRSSSRKPSSRTTRSNKAEKAGDVPRIPSLPLDMDVDLALPELQFSSPADEVATHEAEGGKQLDESQHSPSNRKTRAALNKNKANPTMTTDARESSDGYERRRRSSPVVSDSADSLISGAPPLRLSGKTTTRGIAVRKTRASARQKGANQHAEVEMNVDRVQISSPTSKPLPTPRNRTSTPVKKENELRTIGSAEIDSAVNVSPKTPTQNGRANPVKSAAVKSDNTSVSPKTPVIGRGRGSCIRVALSASASAKGARTGVVRGLRYPPPANSEASASTNKSKADGGKRDDTKMADVDQTKLTPTSVGKTGRDGRVASTPTRRSPRIAKMTGKK